MEIFSSSVEHTSESPTNSIFFDYDPHDDELMHHTGSSDVYVHSELLSDGYSDKIGLTKSLAVSPGDVIKVEGYGKSASTALWEEARKASPDLR